MGINLVMFFSRRRALRRRGRRRVQKDGEGEISGEPREGLVLLSRGRRRSVIRMRKGG
jgi:hypothetical protein